MRRSRIAAGVAVLLGLATNAAITAHQVAVAAPSFAICPANPAQPLVAPEALQSIHAYTTDGSAYAQQRSTGAGVKVAVLADGLDVNNPEFVRLTGPHVIVDYADFSGAGLSAPSEGTLAFGSVSAIAAQGNETYDLSQLVNPAHPLPPGCNVHLLGVAPDASIVAERVGEPGAMSVGSIVQAINYAVQVARVNVIDEPFAINEFPDASGRAVIQRYNDQAVTQGVTVVEAAGDGGGNGTIGSDAADRHVISTGATTDGQADIQTTADGAQFSNDTWLNDNIASSSSGGFTEHGRTVDLVAPGTANWAACSPSVSYTGCVNLHGGSTDLQVFGGTAEASSLTAGAAALVVSAYRSTHGGHSPGPAVVKQILTGTTNDLGVPPSEQGTGLLNADAATDAALTWPGAKTSAPSGVTSNVVTSHDHLLLTGKPGSVAAGTVSVRNVGHKELAIRVGTRRFQKLSTSAQSVGFNSTALPTYVDSSGDLDSFDEVQFTVPSGSGELVEHMAWAGTRNPSSGSVVQITLLSPTGVLAAASEPQGGDMSANSAEVEVRRPAAGTWTALLTSPAGSLGYTGTVKLETANYKTASVGSVSPAKFTLKPGKSRAVTDRVRLPKVSSGDQSDALTIVTSDGHHTAVSVVARPVLDPRHVHGSFRGAIIGGDGRPSTPAETLPYPISVPSPAVGLDASIHLTKGIPGEAVELMLIDPHGNLADLVSNNTWITPKVEAPGAHLQAFIAHPVAGRWLLVLAAANPTPGTAFDQPFTGRVRLRGPTVKAKALPTSTKTHLKPGLVRTIHLHITNPGVQPLLVGLDARTTKYATYRPVAVSGLSTVTLPADPSTEPTYSVPPDTRSFTVTARSSPRTQLEIRAPGGGIDAGGSLTGTSALSRATATEPASGSYLVRGRWGTSLQAIGPFAGPGQSSGQSSLTASLSTLAFNSTIIASVGNPYRDALLGRHSSAPILIAPGKSATITVHLTVRAHRGVQVRGRLNLVTVPNLPTGASTSLPALTTGEVIATLPFRYTVTPKPNHH
jgi:hypothetical protein